MKMNKIVAIIILYFFNVITMDAQSIYDFKVESLTGGHLNLADYKEKKMLIVNTASQCGYTPQYAGLEKLYNVMKDHDFVIIGFPSNEFGKQEPGSNDEIASFCQINYGVTFPMAAKMVVKGDGISPLFEFLTKQAIDKGIEDPIKWNFTKFLIDEQGNLVGVFPSKVDPMSEELQNAILSPK